MNYQPVIGLEVHVELNTESKMFCRCSADYFGKEPNTHTCPVCLGLPGALPYINQDAINSCMKIGLALGCKVSEKSLFERKNYFYPDLAKGYQISQYRYPLCVSGQLTLDSGKVIRINRAHQEEDTGKLTHRNTDTLIDFNRSGVPLVEIVTEPDFTDSREVRDYAKKLQQIFRDIGVSNADMEKGDMRLEANVSVRPEHVEGLPNYRVELKNINSFNFMVQAIEYEIQRQIKAIEAGEKLTQETRGWDENEKLTFLQRSKEEAHDYRYFPEPDLPELQIDQIRSDEIRKSLPELSSGKIERLMKKYNLTRQDAATIVNKGLDEFFEESVAAGEKYQVSSKEIANLLINRPFRIDERTIDQITLEIANKKLNKIDDNELEKICQEVISENSGPLADYQVGRVSALQVLIGGVMRKTQGKADAPKVKEILEKLLKS